MHDNTFKKERKKINKYNQQKQANISSTRIKCIFLIRCIKYNYFNLTCYSVFNLLIQLTGDIFITECTFITKSDETLISQIDIQ